MKWVASTAGICKLLSGDHHRSIQFCNLLFKAGVMKKILLITFVSISVWPGFVRSQPSKPVAPPGPLSDLPGALFTDTSLLRMELKGNIRAVMDDRGDAPVFHPLTLSYRNENGQEVLLTVQVKTRGHFRKARENCSYPPLLISFPKKDSTQSTVFAGQVKLKLVMPCKDDSYVVKEWLVYKLYNLITPRSFRARLVKLIMNDDQRKKQSPPLFGILLEDETQVAKRNNMILVNRKLLRPEGTEQKNFLDMAVFEYMIGNTDWSVQYLQNIKLLAKDSMDIPLTVPYDFDHAGIVSPPYAMPAEELQMSSVRERRFRGYCVGDMSRFDQSIALFNSLKNQFYSVYTTCPYLDAKSIKTITEYLDAFYKTINNPKELKKDFTYPCDPNGTGNVVIKGLKED